MQFATLHCLSAMSAEMLPLHILVKLKARLGHLLSAALFVWQEIGFDHNIVVDQLIHLNKRLLMFLC